MGRGLGNMEKKVLEAMNEGNHNHKAIVKYIFGEEAFRWIGRNKSVRGNYRERVANPLRRLKKRGLVINVGRYWGRVEEDREELLDILDRKMANLKNEMRRLEREYDNLQDIYFRLKEKE